MIIEEKDFRLIPNSEHSIFFDLELLYVIRPKGKESRLEFKNVAYGISLPYAIRKIAQYRVSCRNSDAALKLKDYLEEYYKEIDSLKQLCASLE